MEMTDDEIAGLRDTFLQEDWIDVEAEKQINALCEMALAHNAAKRGEPVAWQVLNSDGKIVATRTDKNNAVMFRNYGEGYVVRELFAAPPDLAAKLKEARELIKWLTFNVSMELNEWSKCNDFLARTK